MVFKAHALRKATTSRPRKLEDVSFFTLLVAPLVPEEHADHSDHLEGLREHFQVLRPGQLLFQLR